MNLLRPRPPADLVTITGLTAPDRFVPAPEVSEWILDAYVKPEGPLYNLEHQHLWYAKVGVLWTNAPNSRHGLRILGQAEMPGRSLSRMGPWQKGRAEQQLREWFGEPLDFLLTFDAVHANESDDRMWCALCEHEMRHCAQELDDFGSPKFDKLTGKPKFAMRGHQVEAFVADVARYGADAMSDDTADLVIAAVGAHLTDLQIARACRGNKVLRAVEAA